MAIRPLPGELLEHLPRGIDQSQISHHVPLRGGPDGLLGETHLLLFHGELIVLTRGSARAAYRRLDLDPNERAMLLAESWSVQLSLPTRGEPTCFEVSSKEVATVLALISAVKPGQHSLEIELDEDEDEEPSETAAAPASTSAVAAPVEIVTEPLPAKRTATPAAAPVEPRAAKRTATPAAVETAPEADAPEPLAAAPTPVPETPAAPEPWRPTTNLRDAFAAASEPQASDDFAGAPFDDDDDPLDHLDDLNIDLEDETPRPGPLASSVRDIAASFRGAAASLRSAASSLRRGRDEPELGDLPPVDFDDAPSSDEESLAVDIDEAFADFELPSAEEPPKAAMRPAAVIPPPEPARPTSATEAIAKPEAPRVVAKPQTPAAPSQPLRPAATAQVTTPAPRAAMRFNFDDLPSPEAIGGGSKLRSDSDGHTEDVSLAEFFDRHVPPTSEDTPARRRRRMVPETPSRRVEAGPQSPRTGPTGTPVAPPLDRTPSAPLHAAPQTVATAASTRSAKPANAAPTAVKRAAAPAPAILPPAAAVPPAETPDRDELEEAPINRPHPKRRLDPRWSKGARRSATAAASAASTAATATATAASAAVGRARVAANRLLDRRRTRSGRPRVNRRRLGSSRGRPTMAIAAALMTVAVLIYWALPGDVASVNTDPAASDGAGLTAPLAEMASEIKASQASMVPAAIGSEAPLPGSDDEDSAEAEDDAAEPAVAADRDFYGVATLTPESPQPELLALKECRPLAERGLLVRVKVEIDEPTGTVPEVWVGDSSMDRNLRQCVNRQFKKASFVPKTRGKLIKQRLKLHF